MPETAAVELPQTPPPGKMEVYDASRTYIDEALAGLGRPGPKLPAPIIDKVRTFETMSTQVQTDLRNWMGYTLKERLSRVTMFQLKGPEGEDGDAAATRLEVRWKALCWIVQEESRHPKGIKAVAEIAFNMLFEGRK